MTAANLEYVTYYISPKTLIYEFVTHGRTPHYVHLPNGDTSEISKVTMWPKEYTYVRIYISNFRELLNKDTFFDPSGDLHVCSY